MKSINFSGSNILFKCMYMPFKKQLLPQGKGHMVVSYTSRSSILYKLTIMWWIFCIREPLFIWSIFKAFANLCSYWILETKLKLWLKMTVFYFIWMRFIFVISSKPFHFAYTRLDRRGAIESWSFAGSVWSFHVDLEIKIESL